MSEIDARWLIGPALVLVAAIGIVIAGLLKGDRECRCEGLYPTQRAETGPWHHPRCREYMWIPQR